MEQPSLPSSLPSPRPRSPHPHMQFPSTSMGTDAHPGGAGSLGEFRSSASEQSREALSDPHASSQAEDLSPPALKGSNLSSSFPPQTSVDPPSYRAQLSHYGYASDPYMDSYTKKGLGNSNNQLLPGIVAIDPESQQRYGIKNGDIVSFTLDDGTTYTGYVGDTTAKGLGPRFDVYDPSGNLVTHHDGQQGTLRVEVDAQKRLTGKNLDVAGPQMLKQFMDSQSRVR